MHVSLFALLKLFKQCEVLNRLVDSIALTPDCTCMNELIEIYTYADDQQAFYVC